jgi:hypothetical protein
MLAGWQKATGIKKPVKESAGLNHSPDKSRSYILFFERHCKIKAN